MIQVFLDRIPVGGFNYYAYLSVIGVKPPDPEPPPQRPVGYSENEEDIWLQFFFARFPGG